MACPCCDFVEKKLVVGCDKCGALAAPGEIGPRMRLEGHDRGRQAVCLGVLMNAHQYGLMPAMDAVEIAYRDRAGALAIEAGQGAINNGSSFHTREFTILCCLTLELLSWMLLFLPAAGLLSLFRGAV